MHGVLKMANFEMALKKGELGEAIIRQRLEAKGWIVYFPFTKNRPHYFDMLATYEKAKVIAIDVKTKARLNKYNAQGIDTRHYDQYMAFVKTSKVQFWIVFIDEYSGDIHTARLDHLRDPVYLCDGKIMAWSLDQMTSLGKITHEQRTELQGYNQRNYDYQPHFV